ncbi:hypothetical protein EB001_27335, partial [bacterium]|nr:hypothetical protein [bacterium]
QNYPKMDSGSGSASGSASASLSPTVTRHSSLPEGFALLTFLCLAKIGAIYCAKIKRVLPNGEGEIVYEYITGALSKQVNPLIDFYYIGGIKVDPTQLFGFKPEIPVLETFICNPKSPPTQKGSPNPSSYGIVLYPVVGTVYFGKTLQDEFGRTYYVQGPYSVKLENGKASHCIGTYVVDLIVHPLNHLPPDSFDMHGVLKSKMHYVVKRDKLVPGNSYIARVRDLSEHDVCVQGTYVPGQFLTLDGIPVIGELYSKIEYFEIRSSLSKGTPQPGSGYQEVKHPREGNIYCTCIHVSEPGEYDEIKTFTFIVGPYSRKNTGKVFMNETFYYDFIGEYQVKHGIYGKSRSLLDFLTG